MTLRAIFRRDKQTEPGLTNHQIGMIAREAALSQMTFEREQHVDALVEIADLKAAIESLETKVQVELLKQGMQIDALLKHFERQQKMPLEFVTVPAQGERVEVRRKG